MKGDKNLKRSLLITCEKKRKKRVKNITMLYILNTALTVVARNGITGKYG